MIGIFKTFACFLPDPIRMAVRGRKMPSSKLQSSSWRCIRCFAKSKWPTVTGRLEKRGRHYLIWEFSAWLKYSWWKKSCINWHWEYHLFHKLSCIAISVWCFPSALQFCHKMFFCSISWMFLIKTLPKNRIPKNGNVLTPPIWFCFAGLFFFGNFRNLNLALAPPFE